MACLQALIPPIPRNLTNQKLTIPTDTNSFQSTSNFPMNMPFLSMLFGFLLAVIGVAGYFFSGSGSMTALIPAAFGIILYICGRIALVAPGLRKHVMHVAALVGLLGTLGGLGMAIPKLGLLFAGEAERPLAIYIQLGMGVASALFVVLCVKSFIDARRSGKV